jgi:anti-sigma B factor antagonist
VQEEAMVTVAEAAVVDAPGPPADRPAPESEITVHRGPEALVVRLAGDIDAGMRDAASEAMVAVVRETLPLVIDTSGVTFIDSSGLAFLMQLHRVATDGDRTVALRDPSRVVVDLLAMIGLDRLFVDEQG